MLWNKTERRNTEGSSRRGMVTRSFVLAWVMNLCSSQLDTLIITKVTRNQIPTLHSEEQSKRRVRGMRNQSFGIIHFLLGIASCRSVSTWPTSESKLTSECIVSMEEFVMAAVRGQINWFWYSTGWETHPLLFDITIFRYAIEGTDNYLHLKVL